MSDYLYSVEHRLKLAEEDVRRLQAENAALVSERDEWARKWHKMRRELAEMKYPGMNAEVHALGAEELKSVELQKRLDGGIRVEAHKKPSWWFGPHYACNFKELLILAAKASGISVRISWFAADGGYDTECFDDA